MASPQWTSQIYTSYADRLNHELALFELEYEAMLYGEQGSEREARPLYAGKDTSCSMAALLCIYHDIILPTHCLLGGATTNQTTPHFVMSEEGTGIAVRPDSRGRDVLYTYIGCLCEFTVWTRVPLILLPHEIRLMRSAS